MNVQRASERPPQPWRNGRGVQYEIAANGPLEGGWTWRLSTADLTEDVPFSAFPGVVRHFCVADGEGVRLMIDGVSCVVGPGSVTRFMGDAEVYASLVGGPVRALNLMTARGDTSSIAILRVGMSSVAVRAVVAIRGNAEILLSGHPVALDTLDAVVGLDGESVSVQSGEVAVLLD